MKIIGLRPSSFTGNDGVQVDGFNIYMTGPLSNGQGLEALRVFVTRAKLGDWPYQPKIGDEVDIRYNRYGKCEELILLSEGK